MKKKWMSGMLCTVMVAGSMTPVYAQTSESGTSDEKVALEQIKEDVNISKEKAIELAKEAMNIPEDYERENVRFDTHYRNSQVWRIGWSKRENNDYHNIDVTIDADTGNVVSLSQYNRNPDEERSFPPEVNYNDAVLIAKSYVNKHFPDLKGGLVLDERIKEQSQERPFRRTYEHHIEFNQQINGVPLEQNRISFRITGNGTIQNMNFNWNYDIEFDNPEKVLSNQEARDELYEQFTAGLQYKITGDPYRTGEDVEPKLTYIPVSKVEEGYRGFGLLDAETGDWVNHYGEPYGEDDTYNISDEPLADESETLDVREEEISQEEAAEIVKKVVDIPEGYELKDSNYNENQRRPDEHPTWRLYWRSDSQNHPMEDIRVTVDAKTGEIISYYDDRNRYMGNEAPEDFEVTLTEEEAKEKAIEFVKIAAKTKLDKLYLRSPREVKFSGKDVPRSYDITFVRKENGLRVESQQITVNIASDTGEISRYYQRWDHDLEFPAVKDVISEEKAKDMLLDNYNMKLVHRLPSQRDDEEENKETMLVYQPSPEITNYGVYLDAQTGKWMNPETGEVYREEKQEAQDIDDHPQKEELQNMLDYNILELDEDNNLNPDQELTRAGLVKVMMKALGYDRYYYGRDEDVPFDDISKEHEEYRFILTAIQRELLDTEEDHFKPDEKADRAFMAKLIVEALNYDKLASFEGVFQPSFEDVKDEKYAGHIALVNRLGILTGDGDEFNPGEAVSKAEAAVALTKFLELEPKLNENR